MDKDDKSKDSVEPTAPNDVDHDEAREDVDDNPDNNDKEDSTDFSTSSFASCNEEQIESGSNSPSNIDGNDGEANPDDNAEASEQDDSDEMMENPEESDQDDMIQVETLTTGGTAGTTEAQKKLQEERTAVLKKPQSKSRSNFIQDFLSHSQYTMKPAEFRKRRQGDLGLVQRFKLSHMLEGHRGCVNAIHFNESGSKLASGSDDLDIFVWDWLRGKKLLSFHSGHTSNVFQSKFLPLTGDTHIVTTSRDGQVRLAELSETGTCRSTRKLGQHKGAAHKLALLNGRPHEFISGGEDGLIMGLDVRQSTPDKLLVQEEDGSKVRIYSVHASPVEDHFIISAGNDQFVRLYDRRNMAGTVKKFCPSHLESERRLHITCAVFSNDGQNIIGSFSDEDIYSFKTRDSAEKPEYDKRYQGHCNSQTVKGVNFYGPNSEFVVSGSDCGHIFFWDREGEDIVHMVKGDVEGVVNCLEPHPNLPTLATSGLDNQVKIWTPTSENKVERSYIEETVMTNGDPNQRGSNQSSLMGGQQMIMLQLLRHMQRNRRRRRARENGEDEETTEDSEDQSDMSDDNDDDDDDAPLQCAQS